METKNKNSGTLKKRSFLKQEQAVKIDKFLINLAVIFIGILFLSQAFLFKAGTRQFFSMVDRLEGEQIPSPVNLYAGYEPSPVNTANNSSTLTKMSKMANKTLSALRPSQTLVIRIIQPRKSKNAVILINGKQQGDLSEGSASITVYDGDYIEIDSTELKQPAQFVVNVQNQNKVITPLDGMFIEGNQTLLTVGKVKLK